jgi:proteasome alpha subunit
MTMPFYVAPEQVMKDRADYARKGIARGRSLTALVYDDGILICAENPSNTLRKVSEIYDRIAFAGVGRYSEFDQLRIAGVRHADLKGYSFSREDVDARSLANQYAQILNQVFTHDIKPLEVEILVAEVQSAPDRDQLYHILYDGTILDEAHYSVLGGDAEAIADRLDESWREHMDLKDALAVAMQALGGPDRTLGADDIEAAILIRTEARRAFKRLEGTALTDLLPEPELTAESEPAPEPEGSSAVGEEAGEGEKNGDG